MNLSNVFRYSKPTSRLSLSQLIFYEHNGYLLIPKLVPEEILQKCSERYDDIASGKADKSVMTVMRDVADRKNVAKVQDIHQDDVFREYLEYRDLLDYVECFTGPNILVVHSMLIAKPPDVGHGTSRHPPHQDLYYFPFRPANDIVAAWTAIEPCDRANGCLHVSPGSHKLEKLYPHTYPIGRDDKTFNKMYHGIQDLPDACFWIDLEMQPGDTVFFHPLLIHGSGVNVSNRTRKAISGHYASATTCHYIDVEGTVQETIKDEVLEVVRRRYPGMKDVKFTDVWKAKSNLVRGIRSSL